MAGIPFVLGIILVCVLMSVVFGHINGENGELYMNVSNLLDAVGDAVTGSIAGLGLMLVYVLIAAMMAASLYWFFSFIFSRHEEGRGLEMGPQPPPPPPPPPEHDFIFQPNQQVFQGGGQGNFFGDQFGNAGDIPFNDNPNNGRN